MIDLNERTVPFTPEAQLASMNKSLYGEPVTAAFTPEAQLATMQQALYGTNVNNGIPVKQPEQPQLSYEDMMAIEKARNYEDMIRNGSLTVNAPKLYGQPNNQQYAQQDQVQSQQSNSSPGMNDGKSDSDLLNELLGIGNPSSIQDNTNAKSDHSRQNAAPIETVVQENVNRLYTEAVQQGVNGNDVINFIQNISPKDYVDLFRAYKQYQTQPSQPQNAMNSQGSYQSGRVVGQYSPSIAVAGNGMPNRRQQPANPFEGYDKQALSKLF
jgi:hypothetical protein